jgi:hypothetical protein
MAAYIVEIAARRAETAARSIRIATYSIRIAARSVEMAGYASLRRGIGPLLCEFAGVPRLDRLSPHPALWTIGQQRLAHCRVPLGTRPQQHADPVPQTAADMLRQWLGLDSTRCPCSALVFPIAR